MDLSNTTQQPSRTCTANRKSSHLNRASLASRPSEPCSLQVCIHPSSSDAPFFIVFAIIVGKKCLLLFVPVNGSIKYRPKDDSLKVEVNSIVVDLLAERKRDQTGDLEYAFEWKFRLERLFESFPKNGAE